MKKNKFLKLVMSYGVQRNEAAHMAASVGVLGAYEALFNSIRPALAFRSMAMAFRHAGKSITAAARGFRDLFAAAFGGVDVAAGEDQSVVVHHVRSRCGGTPSLQIMTHEEHTAAHAAGREGAEYGKK